MTDTTISDNTSGVHQGDYAGTEDAAINEANATTNYGSATDSEISKFGTQSIHMLLSFSGLSNISATDTVSAATVGIYEWDQTNTTARTATVKRLLRAWVEAQVTWNIWSTSNNWGTAGATNSSDRSTTTTATFTMATSGTGVFYTYTGAQTAADVEDFIDGTVGNYGWHHERTDGSNDSTYDSFTVSDSTNELRPYLDVTHAAAGGSALLLLDT